MSVLFVALAGIAAAQDPSPAAGETPPEPAPEVQGRVVEGVSDHPGGIASEPPRPPDPRIVQESWARFEVDDPRAEADALTRAVREAGGLVRSASASMDRTYGDSASLVVEVPVEAWPAIESMLSFDGSGSLEHDRIPRSQQQGDGLPQVSLSVDYTARGRGAPNVLVGPVGGLALPADDTGLGLAQVMGARVMDPDREGSFEVLYAPSRALLADTGEPWMLQLTGGASVYSDYLGGGELPLLNPFLGARIGYAYRGESWFLLQGEMGLELLHLGHVIWDVHARPTGAFRKGAVGLSLEGGTGLVVPF